MAEIVWTLEAAQWLEDIYEYIASEGGSSAHKVVTGIYDKIQLLRRHPRIGQRYEPIADREVREILYGHYRIAYLVKSEDRVEILGIFHSAMDIERYLRQSTRMNVVVESETVRRHRPLIRITHRLFEYPNWVPTKVASEFLGLGIVEAT